MSDAHAEHADAQYVKVWAWLVVLLVLSILGPVIGIFTGSSGHADGCLRHRDRQGLPGRQGIHAPEPRAQVRVYTVTTVVVFMFLFYAGTAPDVMRKRARTGRSRSGRRLRPRMRRQSPPVMRAARLTTKQRPAAGQEIGACPQNLLPRPGQHQHCVGVPTLAGGSQRRVRDAAVRGERSDALRRPDQRVHDHQIIGAHLAAARPAATADRADRIQHPRVDRERVQLLFYAVRIAKKDREKARGPMFASLALGAFFVIFQGYEWVRLIGQGFTLTSSSLGSFFYLIAGGTRSTP